MESVIRSNFERKRKNLYVLQYLIWFGINGTIIQLFNEIIKICENLRNLPKDQDKCGKTKK